MKKMSKLQDRRKELDMTQVQLSRKSSVSLKQIQAIESDFRKIETKSVVTLYKLSKALKCDMEELVDVSKFGESE